MIFFSENSGRNLRVARLVLAHFFLVVLSIGFACEPGDYYFDIEEGPFALRTPNKNGIHRASMNVDLYTEDAIDEGALIGVVSADNCNVIVAICDDGECHKVIERFLTPDKDLYFEEWGDDNYLLDHYFDKFEGCETTTSFGCMSCSHQCSDPSHDLMVVLDSDGCPARLEFTLNADVVDEGGMEWEY